MEDNEVPAVTRAARSKSVGVQPVASSSAQPPPPLPTQPSAVESRSLLPPAPASYPLFAYLHSRGFFMTPGLRFGCQYTAYPGDPLRFHSHFQATCYGWDEEVAVLDLVAGGRLGTGVKKGFLVGGAVVGNGGSADAGGEEVGDGDGHGDGDGGVNGMEVRAFCIEWAGM